ncbi:ethanolamine permease [Tomitella biformata]|uniref:ethanolamine permease n=1 Tax=Tomitella biformata TaxID=630403 RepID=UPI0004664715|nr:ethanolamine permease [Tomitella biformata]
MAVSNVSAGAAPPASDDASYLAKRTLKSGSAGWVLLAGLGVSFVISGDYAGWQFGLVKGGWGGLLIAVIVVAFMYLCMCLSLAELSSALPTAGGGYTFARRALGPWGGFATGAAVLIEYTIAPAAIATFIGGYVQSLNLFGITAGWPVYLACYAIFVGIHLFGAGEALKVMFVVTAVAVVALIVFFVGMIPHFSFANLTDIPADPGGSAFLPHGAMGIWAAIPFGIWFFLALEGVPLAAEEAKDPARSVPRGILTALGILFTFAMLVLFLGPGGAGSNLLKDSSNPLVQALDQATGSGMMGTFVNYAGLFGLIASFFSIVYAYSRQTFALSRAGYLPKTLSLTSGRKVPALALIVPGVIGFGLSMTEAGDRLLNAAVFGAVVSYALMMLSHIVLRRKAPDMERPYRTPGGAVTSGIALTLACVAIVATFLADVLAAGIALGIYALLLAYFGLYSRKRLVAGAPEEEFAALAEAEAQLR